MKFNLTHAVVGVAVLLLLVKVAKSNAAKTAPTTTTAKAGPTADASQWWSFAGWGG